MREDVSPYARWLGGAPRPLDMSGLFRGVPRFGRPVVPRRSTTHDEVVSTIATAPEPGGSIPRAALTGNLRPDLEWFWPSRRGHAYDEFCRSSVRPR
jgi:hypothetical protein